VRLILRPSKHAYVVRWHDQQNENLLRKVHVI